jgi:hypothetical protein
MTGFIPISGDDGMDKMFEWMQASAGAASAALAPEQKAISWGDYWLRIFEFQDSIGEPSLVVGFGRVLTLKEIQDAEDPETVRQVIANHERDYLFCDVFSEIVPRGELGDVHRFNMWPITEEQFEIAKAHDWHATDPAVAPWVWELVAALKVQHIRHNAELPPVPEEFR